MGERVNAVVIAPATIAMVVDLFMLSTPKKLSIYLISFTCSELRATHALETAPQIIELHINFGLRAKLVTHIEGTIVIFSL
jgi:hypothetical protein